MISPNSECIDCLLSIIVLFITIGIDIACKDLILYLTNGAQKPFCSVHAIVVV